MSRITRKLLKIFALGASNNGQFGSAQTGAKVTSNNLDTLQALAAYNTGWLDAVLGTKKFPALEEFQALGYICTYEIAYLFQEGIPEYEVGTTYYQKSIVKKPGTYQLYGSVTDANVGNAITDATNWVFLIDLANNTLPTDLVYETHTQTVTNKTLVLPILNVLDSEFTIQHNGDATKQALFDLSGLTTGQTRVYSLPDATATLLGAATTQTIQNKTLDNTNTINVKTGIFTLQDSTDTTKRARFDTSGIGSGQTRIFALQDKNGTVALLSDIPSIPTPIFTNYFESAPQALNAGTPISVSHSLGAAPKFTSCEMVCVNAEKGYSVGDRVLMSSQDSGSSTIISLWSSATQIGFNVFASSINILNKGAQSTGFINFANWNLILKGFV